MKPTDLIAGPYYPPLFVKGRVTFCLYRDCDVVITSWSNAPIAWPRCQVRGRHGGPGLLVNEELAHAAQTRRESGLGLSVSARLRALGHRRILAASPATFTPRRWLLMLTSNPGEEKSARTSRVKRLISAPRPTSWNGRGTCWRSARSRHCHCLSHPVKQFGPIAWLPLAEQSHCRIPGAILAVSLPAPVGHEG